MADAGLVPEQNPAYSGNAFFFIQRKSSKIRQNVREHAQVAHLIFQVGDTLYAHTKGIAAIDGGVDATLFEHVGVNHTASQNLYPAGVLAEAAALAATDEARDVHLGTGFCEGEVAGTQANLRVGAEHLAGEAEQHLLQVGERYILVDIEALHLMEEAVGASRDGLVAVNAARADDADGL